MGNENRNVLILVAIAALVGVYWFASDNGKPHPDHRELTAFLGTWTDEKGPPDNYARFNLVTRPLPNALPGVQVSEGQGRLHGLFGENNQPITWNYESHQPLRLNVSIGKRTFVAPVRLLDADHMLLRVVPTTDVDVWSADEVLDGPGVIHLTRRKDEAEGP
jgi:hypothetical protein